MRLKLRLRLRLRGVFHIAEDPSFAPNIGNDVSSAFSIPAPSRRFLRFCCVPVVSCSIVFAPLLLLLHRPHLPHDRGEEEIEEITKMTRKNHTPAVVVLVVLVFASLVLGGAIPEQTPTILWSFNSSSTYQQPNSISLRSNDAVVLSTYQWTSSGYRHSSSHHRIVD